MNKLIFFLLITPFLSPADSYQKEYETVSVKGETKIRAKADQKTSSSSFKSVASIQNHMAMVGGGSKYGCYDLKEDKFILPIEYAYYSMKIINENLVMGTKDKVCRIFNREGKIIHEFPQGHLRYSNEHSLIVVTARAVGPNDVRKRNVHSIHTTYLYHFASKKLFTFKGEVRNPNTRNLLFGFALIESDETSSKFGCIDTESGLLVLPMDYDQIDLLSKGLFATHDDQKVRILDRKGNKLADFIQASLALRNDRYVVFTRSHNIKDSFSFLLDLKNNKVAELKLGAVREEVAPGIFSFNGSEAWGLVKLNGEILAKSQFEKIEYDGKKFFCGTYREGGTAIFDENGEIAVSLDKGKVRWHHYYIDNHKGFYKGTLVAKDPDGTGYLVGRNGEILSKKYPKSNLSYQYGFVSAFSDSKWSLCTFEGKALHDEPFDRCYQSKNHLVVIRNGLSGIFNKQGKLIREVKYKRVHMDRDGISATIDGEKVLLE
ncbi:hypothetical protein PQO03_18300 [Lentisphaera profundi]|uniref:WG repeat-containing protein n=1 Tax=Lentisphaera profundi TaxID=1658616 RepID=A0ABY7VYB1_9BACT|nr:hypothetical protein [Lentisphaera profundi]WDE97781.1 hypothetical protein PQO03_18300 [Lentisphaera profundi]